MKSRRLKIVFICSVMLISGCQSFRYSEFLTDSRIEGQPRRDLIEAMAKTRRAYVEAAQLENNLPEAERYSDEAFFSAINYWHQLRGQTDELYSIASTFNSIAVDVLGAEDGANVSQRFFLSLAREYGYVALLGPFIRLNNSFTGMDGFYYTKDFIIHNDLEPTKEAARRFDLYDYVKMKRRGS